MTRQEREEFLAGLHVGVMSVAAAGRGPLTLPIWYAYEPGGEVVVITAANSTKARLLGETGRFSLCAQTEEPPYKYVSVEGAVTKVEPASLERDGRPMAHRYLGPELGDAYVESTRALAAGSVVIHMRPERWNTVDYGKEFATQAGS